MKRKSTFAIFVDFKKAYDAIDRSKLFIESKHIGIAGKMYNALLSLYEDVKSCVKVNGLYTDWFPVGCGLKQGCCLSPILFNFYINDLVNTISSFGIGINLGDEVASVLFYADDLVLLAETETDLQILIDLLKVWCDEKKMRINLDKTKIIHFRSPSIPKSNISFQFLSFSLAMKASELQINILILAYFLQNI